MNFKDEFNKCCSNINVPDSIYRDTLDNIYKQTTDAAGQANMNTSIMKRIRANMQNRSRTPLRVTAAIACAVIIAVITVTGVSALKQRNKNDGGIGGIYPEPVYNAVGIKPFTVLAGPSSEAVTKIGITISPIPMNTCGTGNAASDTIYDFSALPDSWTIAGIYDVNLSVSGSNISRIEYLSSSDNFIFLPADTDDTGSIVFSSAGTSYSIVISDIESSFDADDGIYVALITNGEALEEEDPAADITACVTFDDGSISVNRYRLAASDSTMNNNSINIKLETDYAEAASLAAQDALDKADATRQAGADAAEEAVPGTRQKVLSGEVKPTAAEIASVARAPPEERPALVAEICKPKSPKPPAQKQKAPPAVAAPLPDTSTSDEEAPDEEPTSTPAPSEPIFPQKENKPLKVDRQQILEIANNRYHVKQLANGTAMLCEVSGAANSMMRRWESVFREYPDILSDAENRASVGRTIQKLRDYLKNLEDKMEELL